LCLKKGEKKKGGKLFKKSKYHQSPSDLPKWDREAKNHSSMVKKFWGNQKQQEVGLTGKKKSGKSQTQKRKRALGVTDVVLTGKGSA